ncbi:MAG TPA: bifunctional phosphoribosylaminoimidazolecarboxamide formyltransferase/IMP cyclohydrolase [Actinopolymorphaceae bacterium]
MSSQRPVRRALISVYDKSGLTQLAQGLADAGVELVSTGSTAATIEAAGIPVTPVEQVTGFPECLDGRVKTLHPAVHAGLLADLRDEDHVRQLESLEIASFDLLVSNLYPFTQTVASGAGGPDEIVEQIDIGGPAMVRSAAKNHASVAVVVSPSRYPDVLSAVTSGGFTLEQRKALAAEAFAHVADYDVAIARWFAEAYAPADDSGFPEFLGSTFRRSDVLRYGENPHQRAALFEAVGETGGLSRAEQLHGKEMSYNNYVDADAARRAAYDFTMPCVAIIKHANPCGIAVGVDIASAHAKAHACDPVSAYGGVIATNRPVTEAMARQVAEVFTEVVVAPEFEPEALEILTRKKNVRLLRCAPPAEGPRVETRQVSGGVLLQETDRVDAPGDDPSTWTLVAGTPASDTILADLEFAWRAVRAVKSNAILLAVDGATVGVGMGQVNRVDSARLAVARADTRTRGSVAASDAFFPFADGLQVLIDAGVTAVVEPGGSVRDEEVIAAASAAGVTLYFSGARHFFH